MSSSVTRTRKKLPRVALVGRRNVGKSTLLNALYGRRRAITDAHAGLTRDVLEVEVRRGPYHFLLCDTPGLDVENPDEIEGAAVERARAFIREVDLVLFLFEAPAPAAFDHEFLELIRKGQDDATPPTVFAVNKVDGSEQADDVMAEFYEAGVPEFTPVSAKGRWNLDTLLENMETVLPALRSPHAQEDVPAGEKKKHHRKREKDLNTNREDSTVISDSGAAETRIAVVGRPNAGKSSLLNRFAGREVALVSDVAGTTRDTVDTIFNYHGQAIRVVDTAGMRRPGKLRDPRQRVDFYSVSRTKRAIRDCRVVVHVIDATVGVTDFDKKISALIREYGRPVVIAVNKWDAYQKDEKHDRTLDEFRDRMEFLFPHVKKIPIVFCSALTGQRVGKIIETALDLEKRMQVRAPTGELNRSVERWLRRAPGSVRGLKILYVNQADVEPPVFVFFVNRKKEFRGDMLRYFENRLREQYRLDGIPLRIFVREKDKAEAS